MTATHTCPGYRAGCRCDTARAHKAEVSRRHRERAAAGTVGRNPGGPDCIGSYKAGCRCDYHLEQKAAQNRRLGEARAAKAGREYVPQDSRHQEESTPSRGAPLLRATMSADLTSRTYEPLSTTYCGEERNPGHYCKRQIPCQVHGEAS